MAAEDRDSVLKLGTGKLVSLSAVNNKRNDGPPSKTMSEVPVKPLGLYDPSFEKDACGVGFIADLSGKYSHETVSFFSTLSSHMLLSKFYLLLTS